MLTVCAGASEMATRLIRFSSLLNRFGTKGVSNSLIKLCYIVLFLL